MDELFNNTYLVTSIILTVLLIISELLGWAKCDANSITQLYKCLSCKPADPPPLPIVIRPRRIILNWTQGNDPTMQLEEDDWSV